MSLNAKFYPEDEEGGKNSAGGAVLCAGSVGILVWQPQGGGIASISQMRKLMPTVPKGFEVMQK